MEKLLKKHAEKIRFIIVGGGLTVLDFVLLFIATGLGVDKIIANYLSTSISMVVSFFVNKSFTFQSSDGNTKKQFAAFVIVTIIGLWVIQPVVILLVTNYLGSYIASNEINLFIAKLVATLASLIWNYILYSRLVFKKSNTNSEKK